VNIFLINEDPRRSAIDFAILDPIRARKQLLEGVQLLASVEIIRTGSTAMRKKDGEPYRLAHPHHPLTRRMIVSRAQWSLCYDVVNALSEVFPDHACSRSFARWVAISAPYLGANDRLLIVRKGEPPTLVNSRREYAVIMSHYLATKRRRQ